MGKKATLTEEREIEHFKSVIQAFRGYRRYATSVLMGKLRTASKVITEPKLKKLVFCYYIHLGLRPLHGPLAIDRKQCGFFSEAHSRPSNIRTG
jgi:hypothetical protein